MASDVQIAAVVALKALGRSNSQIATTVGLEIGEVASLVAGAVYDNPYTPPPGGSGGSLTDPPMWSAFSTGDFFTPAGPGAAWGAVREHGTSFVSLGDDLATLTFLTDCTIVITVQPWGEFSADAEGMMCLANWGKTGTLDAADGWLHRSNDPVIQVLPGAAGRRVAEVVTTPPLCAATGDTFNVDGGLTVMSAGTITDPGDTLLTITRIA